MSRVLMEAIAEQLGRSSWYLTRHPRLLFQSLYNALAHADDLRVRDWARELRSRPEAAAIRPWIEDLTPEPDPFLRFRLASRALVLPDRCAVSGDGHVAAVFAAAVRGYAVIFDLGTGRPILEIPGWQLRLIRGSLSRDGSRVVTNRQGETGEDVVLHREGDLETLFHVPEPLCAVKATPDHRHVAALAASGRLWLYSREAPRPLLEVTAEPLDPDPEPGHQIGQLTLPPLPPGLRTALHFGAGGALLVVGLGRRIRVLDTTDGQLVSELVITEGPVEDCAASDSPFRLCVLAGSALILFEGDGLRPGEQLREVAVLRSRMPDSKPSLGVRGGCVAISADGSRVASATQTVVEVRSWTTKALQASLPHAVVVSDVDCSEDGETIVSVDDTGGYVWSVPRKRLPASTVPPVESMVDACPEPLGRELFSVSVTGILNIWNVREGPTTPRPLAETMNARRLCPSPDGRHLVAISERPGLMQVWDHHTRLLQNIVTGQLRSSTIAIFSPDGGMLMTVLTDGRIALWSTRSWQRVALMSPILPVAGCVFTPDGREVVTLSADGHVQKWATPGGQLADQATVQSGFDREARELVASPDGRLLLVATWQLGHVALDLLTLRELGRFGSHKHVQGTLALLSRSEIICGVDDLRGANQHGLAWWSCRDFARLSDSEGHDGEIIGCRPLADGIHVLSAGEDSWLRIWDSRTGEEVAALPVAGVPQSTRCSRIGGLILASRGGGRLQIARLQWCKRELPPTVVGWRDLDGLLWTSCPTCHVDRGFLKSAFRVPEDALGSDVRCGNGHVLWMLRWPLGRIPIWCDEDYRRDFLTRRRD